MMPLLGGLLDDAALFPPGNATMPDAVRGHLRAGALWYRDAVGSFVCPASRVEELEAELARAGRGPIHVSVTCPGGVSELATAAKAAAASPLVRLDAIEAPLLDSSVAAAQSELRDYMPTVYVEIPADSVHGATANSLRSAGLRLKLRTGGRTAAAFPSDRALAWAILACAEAGLPFKCTAGLHHAVRRTDPWTGFEHHGFLNIVLAAHAALHDATAAAVSDALAERNPATVSGAITSLAEIDILAARAQFRSFGTCSLEEPLADLVGLGIVSRE